MEEKNKKIELSEDITKHQHVNDIIFILYTLNYIGQFGDLGIRGRLVN
jgi:hypothetical protein